MAINHFVWVDDEKWLARAAHDREGAVVLLGTVVRDLLAPAPHEARDDVGAFAYDEESPAAEISYEPKVFVWNGPGLRQESTRTEDDVRAALGMDPPTPGPSSPCTIVSIEGDFADRVDPEVLGAGIFRLLDDDDRSVELGSTWLRRQIRVDRLEQCVLVWYRGALRDPTSLSPDERHEVISSRRPRARRSEPEKTERPNLAGFLFSASQSERFFVPAGPATTTCLFGRNGAGKTLVLDGMTAALAALAGVPVETTKEDPPQPRVVLSWASQDSSPRLFRALLAGIGWSPMSPLSAEAITTLNARLPAWRGEAARPPNADGLDVNSLAETPLDVLQSHLIDSILETSAWGDSNDVRTLASALLQSPTIAVTSDWHVSFGTHPSESRHLVDPAQSLLERLRHKAGGVTRTDFALYKVAEAAVSGGAPAFAFEYQVCPPKDFGFDPGSGWYEVGFEVQSELRRSVPLPVLFAGSIESIDQQVEMLLLEALDAIEQRPASTAHPFADSTVLAALVGEVNERVARIVPEFVRAGGHIEVSVRPQSEWHAARVEVAFADPHARAVPLERAPAGVRSWGIAAIRFAIAQAQTGTWSAQTPTGRLAIDSGSKETDSTGRGLSLPRRVMFEHAEPSSVTVSDQAPIPLLYILDEPEAHLHLTAQTDAALAAKRLAAEGQGAIVATHSLAFINPVSGLDHVVTLSSAEENGVSAHSSSSLSSLRARADEVGIPPAALAQACRGVLVVEGKDDIEVIKRFGGVDLDEYFVVMVALTGYYGVASIPELEFLFTLDIPIAVLLDHVRRSVLNELLAGTRRGDATGEERALVALDQSLRAHRLGAFALPFPKVDIVCAVPDDDMEWAVEQLGGLFAGWPDVEARADADYQSSGIRFKESFKQQCGVTVTTVLKKLVEGDRRGDSAVLRNPLSNLLDALDSPRSPGLDVLKVRSRRPSS
jgi:hypothetical protein